jgi:hypothetical protein
MGILCAIKKFSVKGARVVQYIVIGRDCNEATKVIIRPSHYIAMGRPGLLWIHHLLRTDSWFRSYVIHT